MVAFRRHPPAMEAFYNWFHRFYGLVETNILPQLRAAVDHLDPQGNRFSGDHILDLGCGSGNLGLVLAPRCGRYEGGDQSEGMLDRARKRWTRDLLPGLPAGKSATYPAPPFRHINLAALSATDLGKPDWIAMSFALHLFPPEDQVRILSTCLKAARKGVLVIDHEQRWRPFLALVERLEGSWYDQYVRMNFYTIALGLGVGWKEATIKGSAVMEFLHPQAAD